LQTNDDLFQKISLYRQYGERAKTVERLHVLEVELQEAMEANMMYKEQLKAALSTHQNVSQAAFSNMGGDVDMILDELKVKKQQARKLERELQDMQGRYSALSLKCAEVEGQREELVQELKRLKGGGHIKKPSR
jgi:chromosome segregation ATPase